MSEQPQRTSVEAGYELSDADTKPILAFLVILAGSLVVTLIVAAWVVGAFEGRAVEREDAPHPMRDFRTDVPGPRLQARPDLEIEEYRRVEELKASTYGWVDPTAGVVRIPHGRALELILQEGLPRVAKDPGPKPEAGAATGSAPGGSTDDEEEGE